MACKKRLIKEFSEKIKDKFSLFNDEKNPSFFFRYICECENAYSEKYALVNNNNNLEEIYLFISMEYPFKPPYVELSSTIVNNFKLINISHKMRKEHTHFPTSQYQKWCGICLKQCIIELNVIQLAWFFTLIKYPSEGKAWQVCPDNINCLCCESILCGNKWSPAYTLYDICNEYILRKTFFIYTSRLMQKNMKNILKNLFCNDRWNIPDDLILYILSLCHSNPLIDDKFLQSLLVSSTCP